MFGPPSQEANRAVTNLLSFLGCEQRAAVQDEKRITVIAEEADADTVGRARGSRFAIISLDVPKRLLLSGTDFASELNFIYMKTHNSVPVLFMKRAHNNQTIRVGVAFLDSSGTQIINIFNALHSLGRRRCVDTCGAL